MIESLLFIFFCIIGLVALTISVVLLAISLFRSSKYLLKIGLIALVISVFSFGLIYWYYFIMIPSGNAEIRKEYIGKYRLEEITSTDISNTIVPDSSYFLILENSGFLADSVPGLNLPKRGIWETGWIDGHFAFKKDNIGNIFPAIPSNKKLTFSEDFESKEFTFVKVDP